MKKWLRSCWNILLLPVLIAVTTSLLSFKKNGQVNQTPGKNISSYSYSANVLDKWMTLQIRLMSSTPANFNGPFVRIYAYSGIAAYAAVYPAISKKSEHRFLISRLNGIPDLPATDPQKKYHWPSSINAALAFMNRSMFPMASEVDKTAIDSLEEAMEKDFGKNVDDATQKFSADYGKQVAEIIFRWAEVDGYRNSSDPYAPPTGQGKWKPTAPKFAGAATPYWGRLRTIVAGSNDNTQPAPPPVYSEDSNSVFYKMVEQVYDISKRLTPEQKNIAFFWKDISPGVTAPGHWLNILRQVIQIEKTPLEKAAFVYALSGMALNDTWISSWKTRYQYNLLRPITYIQTVMGFRDWVPTIPTPPHPEYPGGHAAMSAAVAEALAVVYGNDYSITDHTYDDFGMQPRGYPNFWGIAKEAADSKVYGGVHYQMSVEVGLQQGKDVAQNIIAVLLNKGKKVGSEK